MKKTRFLTDTEKSRGIRALKEFQALNGIGYSFLGDTPVYLLAIMYGATNVQLGYISSASFLAGILLPILPRLMSKRNIVRVLSLSWLLRGVVCIGYLALYYLQGNAAVYLILGLYTSFSLIRTMGVVLFKPIIRMITTSSNQGAVFGGINRNFQLASIISKAVSYAVTSVEKLSGATGILGLQMTGVIINTIAAFWSRRIPCRDIVEIRQGRGVFVLLAEGLRQRDSRRILILQWLCTAVFVLVNLAVPFIRSRVGFSTSEVFLYSIVVTVSAIIAAMIVKTFSDAVGSKPLMVFASVLVVVFTLLWTIVPEALPKPVYYVLGFFTMFVVTMNNMLISKLVIKSMPEDDQVGYSSMINFVIAIISLLLGLIGGRLIDFGPLGAARLLNQYTWTFMVAAGLGVLTLYLSLIVRDQGSMSNKDAASILLSIYGIRAFMNISKLQKTSDPVRKKTVLLSLGSNSNDVATSEIRHILHSPFSSNKAELIRALFYKPRPGLKALLIKDAKDSGSITRYDSLFALGAYPGRETRDALLPMLEDEVPGVRAAAAKSLGRIGCTDLLDRVASLYNEEDEVQCVMDYTIALKNMDVEGNYLKDLFSVRWIDRSAGFRQGRYCLVAELLEMSPSLPLLYQLGNEHRGDGLKDFLDETRDHHGFLNYHETLVHSFSGMQFLPILDFCGSILNELKPEGKYSMIRHSILNYCDRIRELPGNQHAGEHDRLKGVGYSDVLALLYFTYQVVKPG